MSVHWKGQGDLYNPEFLQTLQNVTDDVFYISGVSRPSVTSLFTPNVRYIEITEEGFFGDVVVPPRFSGTAEDLAQVRSNTAASGQVGRLVANDLKSAMVRADLQDTDPMTGKPVSYVEIAKRLEEIRAIGSGTGAELEVFVHGALCISYSGRFSPGNGEDRYPRAERELFFRTPFKWRHAL